MGERVSDGNEILNKAKELDEMERSVTTGEADVLERVLQAFADKKQPKNKDAEKICAMYDKYLGPREEEPDPDADTAEDEVGDAEDGLETLT